MLCIFVIVHISYWASQVAQWQSACQAGDRGFDPWVEKIPWSRKWQPTPVLLPRRSNEQRSLVGTTVQGSHKELDRTRWLNSNTPQARVARTFLWWCSQTGLLLPVLPCILMSHSQMIYYRRWVYVGKIISDVHLQICFETVVFFLTNYFNWRLITLQYCSGFCHTWMAWVSHGCTCVPDPEPPLLPPRPLPQGSPSAPALSALFHALNLHCWSVSRMVIHMFQSTCSLKDSVLLFNIYAKSPNSLFLKTWTVPYSFVVLSQLISDFYFIGFCHLEDLAVYLDQEWSHYHFSKLRIVIFRFLLS